MCISGKYDVLEESGIRGSYRSSLCLRCVSEKDVKTIRASDPSGMISLIKTSW